MSVTILNYIDQTLADTIKAQAIERAERARAAEEAAAAAAAAETSGTDFASVLEDASNTYSAAQDTSSVSCPVDLESIFSEAASTYNVSEKLLKCIAKAESNFNASAVSSKGAVGIMQLMPSTAASLGVSNSYDARENIMGGANLISQLLTKYEGNVSLALAAYNAGSNSVDTYGGIPPYSETQNYVQKILGYMDTEITVPAMTDTSSAGQAGTNTAAGTDFTNGTDPTMAGTDSAADAAAQAGTSSSDTPSGKIAITVLNSIVPLDQLRPTEETVPDAEDGSGLSELNALTGEDREKANAALEAFFASRNISLEKLQNLLNTMNAGQQA